MDRRGPSKPPRGQPDGRDREQEPSDLPADPDALFARLEDAARGHSEGTYPEMFTLVGDAFRETNLSSVQPAALFDVAARIPGVEWSGL